METLLENHLLYHLLIAGIIVIVSIPLARVVRRFLAFAGQKLIKRTTTALDDRIAGVLLKNVTPLMVLAGLHIAMREIRKGTTSADQTVLQVLDYAEALLYILVVVIVVRIVLGFIRETIHWYLDEVVVEGAGGLKLTLGPLTNKISNILVGLVALIVVLDHFDINIGSLLVSLGVGSLAVALAAQDTLANMIAGFVILVDRPFRVGDRIELSSGQVGDVLEIGLRSTKVVNFDNNVMIIPNADLVKGRITNHTHPHKSSRVLLRFEVAYGTDIERVRALLIGLAAGQAELLPDPPPSVFCTALNEFSVQVTFVARAAAFSDVWPVETRLREQAYQAFRREGIEIPLPQRVVHTKSRN